MSRFRKTLRTVWITFGILFFLWMANSFRAQGFDRSVLESDSKVTVEETNHILAFQPSASSQPVGLIFFPGGMVQPEAYAPMLHTIAEHGYKVFIVKLPFGSAPLTSQEVEIMNQALEIISTNDSIQKWVVAGHSRGAAIASRFAHKYGNRFDGLILIGTSHPKEAVFELSTTNLDITKIYASNDGLASVDEVRANARFLPKSTNWILIEGGNHSQFGYYGSQLGDGKAEISREKQQSQTIDAILDVLGHLQAQ